MVETETGTHDRGGNLPSLVNRHTPEYIGNAAFWHFFRKGGGANDICGYYRKQVLLPIVECGAKGRAFSRKRRDCFREDILF